jgi:hypothetical protein
MYWAVLGVLGLFSMWWLCIGEVYPWGNRTLTKPMSVLFSRKH